MYCCLQALVELAIQDDMQDAEIRRRGAGDQEQDTAVRFSEETDKHSDEVMQMIMSCLSALKKQNDQGLEVCMHLSCSCQIVPFG